MANDVKIRLAMEGASVVTSEFDRVRAGMVKLSSESETLKGAFGSISSALTVGAVVAYATRLIDAADAMNDLSQRVGISVQDLAKYELAASQSGTTMESLAKGIKGLSGNLMEHGDALKKAGITATTADGAMKQLADVFASMPDGMEKTTLAVKMFGKSGMDLIPMLNMGAKGLKEAAEKAAKYATQMAIMAPLADAFNDNMAEIALSSKVVGMSLLNDALPGLVNISKAMADASIKGGTLSGIMAGLSAGFENYKTNVRDFWGMQQPSTGGATGGWGDAAAKTSAMDAWRAQFEALMDGIKAEGKAASAASAAKAAAKAAAKERETLMAQDRKSWVDLAEFKIKEYEDELAAQNKLDEERNAYADKMRAEDLKGWVAYAEARVNEDFDMAKQLADQQIEELKRVTDARDKAAAEWQKSVDQYDDIFRTGFADMLNGGKGAWKSFTTSLVTTFKTSVADQIYKMFMQPFVVKFVASMLGITGSALGGAANAATSAAGEGAGSGIMSGIGMATGAFGAGLSGGLAAWGAGGSIAGSLSAGASLLGTGTLAGGMSGAGMIVGALGPIALGIGALVAISKATQGETRSGADYSVNPVTGQLTQGYTVSGGELASKEVRSGISTTAAVISALLLAMGSSSTLEGFQAGLNTSDRGRGGVFAGGTLSGGKTFGETGIGDAYKGTKFEKTSTMSPDAKTAVENFFTDLNQVTIQALQAASDVPKTIADMLAGVDAEALTKDAAAGLVANIDAVIAGVTSFNAAAKTLPFESLKNLSFDAAAGLIAAAGGMDALSSGLSSYYTNFYTEEEQRAQTVKNINATLAGSGFDAATATREQFRALVEAQDVSTDAGRAMYVSLLGVSGAFAGLTPVVNAVAADVAAAAQRMAERVAGALSGLGDTRFSLENDLLLAQGLDPQVAQRIRERELAKLTEGLSTEDAASITASYDYNEALKAQIKSYAEAKTAAEASARAAEEAASAQASAAQEQARAAEQFKSAWQSVADTLFSEAARIRGLMAGSSAADFAGAQAKFAISTAQARAGDQDAAKLLPELSRTLLTLAQANAVSLVELRRIQGQTAASLDATGSALASSYGLKLPSFDVGTNLVPQDMLALVHRGEAIVPAAYNPAAGAGNTARLEALVEALTREVAELRQSSRSIEANTGKTASTLARVTLDGEAMQVESGSTTGTVLLL